MASAAAVAPEAIDAPAAPVSKAHVIKSLGLPKTRPNVKKKPTQANTCKVATTEARQFVQGGSEDVSSGNEVGRNASSHDELLVRERKNIFAIYSVSLLGNILFRNYRLW